MKELAVIIPMYNEQDNAKRCVEAVCDVIATKLPGTQLIVVNDGSSDNTEVILQNLSNQNLPFSYKSHARNAGYGAALLTGFKQARQQGFEFGLVMDSDLTNNPNSIPQFAQVLKTGNFDLVKANRHVQGGGFKGVSLYRRFFSIYGSYFASLLFGMGIRDCTNGFHAVRLSMVCDHEFRESGFPFLLEELYVLKCQKARATEIPNILTARTSGEGRSKFSYAPKVLWRYLKYGLRAWSV